MEVKFTKMHGLGNDFMVINMVSQKVELTEQQIRDLADRHTGVGFDQLLLVESPQLPESDFRYRIFNQDGSEVEQCGNGARCFAKFVKDQGLTSKSDIQVDTCSGVITLHLESDGQVTVNMGRPCFEPTDIPFIGQRAPRYALKAAGQIVQIGAVSVGNPHAVMRVDDINLASVQKLGAALENHDRFPNRTNVGFMQIIDKSHIKLRVYERGVGETKACGTGACAAVVIGQKWELLNDRVDVMLPGGDLVIQWPGGDEPVRMTGPAESVFEGCISI